jgi:simple sugar transport system ATP-binding protein
MVAATVPARNPSAVPASAEPWMLSACGVTKRYGSVSANTDVSLELRSGEIHAVLGENGAGKSTIMKIFYGMVLPDEGSIEIDGKPLALRSPKDAIQAGIGMVFQHFMLVPTLTVLENLALGTELAKGVLLRKQSIRRKLTAIAERYRIAVDLDRRVGSLSVGEQQRVEILKALVRGARALILDEPTAVLTPSEIVDLGTTLRELAAQGHGIIIVTHKLAEVMDISDRVSVMRQGHVIGTWRTKETNAKELVLHMVGRDLQPARASSLSVPGRPILQMRNVVTEGLRGPLGLRSLSLDIAAGEIVGLAGVEGNGQSELAEAITGLRRVDAGTILLDGKEISNWKTGDILAAGVAHVPEDRHHNGVVLGFSVAENAILVGHQDRSLHYRGFLASKQVARFAQRLIGDFDIRCDGAEAEMSGLSGGNQQKLVLGRELARSPKLLIAMQPTRGLDVGAIEYVHARLAEQRAAGMAILLISTELEELLTLSDRIVVLRDGRITGEVCRSEATTETIGNLMLGEAGVPS